MEEFKKNIVTEQTVYEITKEELNKIKSRERTKGRLDIINYFIFSMQNYEYKLNLKGFQLLMSDIVNFLGDKTDTIPNVYGYSLHDYVRRYIDGNE